MNPRAVSLAAWRLARSARAWASTRIVNWLALRATDGRTPPMSCSSPRAACMAPDSRRCVSAPSSVLSKTHSYAWPSAGKVEVLDALVELVARQAWGLTQELEDGRHQGLDLLDLGGELGVRRGRFVVLAFQMDNDTVVTSKSLSRGPSPVSG